MSIVPTSAANAAHAAPARAAFLSSPLAPGYTAQMPPVASSLSTEQAQFAAEMVHTINAVRTRAVRIQQQRIGKWRGISALAAQARDLSDLALIALRLLAEEQARTARREAAEAARLEADCAAWEAEEWGSSAMQSDALEHLAPSAF